MAVLKFIYSEKVTKFCEIFRLLLSYVVPVKSKVKIAQNFVTFSEYMNFNKYYFVSIRGQFQNHGKGFGCFQNEIRFPKYQLERQKFRP